MERVAITNNLPPETAQQAKSAGLLSDERIEQLLVDELDREHRLDRFFDDLDRLSALDLDLTLDNVEAEI